MVDLAPDIGDAVARSMPLIGGAGVASHDWGNLLTMAGLLDYSQGLARLCFGVGMLLMLVALAWGAVLLRMQYATMQAGRRDLLGRLRG